MNARGSTAHALAAGAPLAASAWGRPPRPRPRGRPGVTTRCRGRAVQHERSDKASLDTTDATRQRQESSQRTYQVPHHDHANGRSMAVRLKGGPQHRIVKCVIADRPGQLPVSVSDEPARLHCAVMAGRSRRDQMAASLGSGPLMAGRAPGPARTSDKPCAGNDGQCHARCGESEERAVWPRWHAQPEREPEPYDDQEARCGGEDRQRDRRLRQGRQRRGLLHRRSSGDHRAHQSSGR
jgi:hypothetical protein